MTTFKDILKSSFLDLENFLKIDLTTAFYCMIGSLVCGLLIYIVYKYFYKGVVYNNNFNILLVMVCVVTTFIIMVVSSNVVLSLGMVGALSIVRFRTAIKDPLDTGFIFWAVAVGIASGAGLYGVAIFASVLIGIIYVLLTKLIRMKSLYLLILHYDNEAEGDIFDNLSGMKYKIKNKSESGKGCEMIVQFSTKKLDTSMTGKLRSIGGIHSVSIVEYDGDYAQ
ncbi:MAG: DUF4956 domain-containing protein [Oscillospiraceae bacterium]|nr:DUF4956 domain-containing protein [Oscillospiraceae bacterium]